MQTLSARFMSTALDDAIIQRISFLREALLVEHKLDNMRTFQAQIRILQTAQLDRIDELIKIRRTDLKASKTVADADRLFAEIDALEWLQRQAKKRINVLDPRRNIRTFYPCNYGW
jgi:hypothetical protein